MNKKQPASAVPGHTWTRSSEGRGVRTALDRETVTRAAIEILDQDGVDGLSMRKLGSRLGTAATTLYWHVSNKEELLDVAFDEVMRELPDLNSEASGDWRADVRTALDALREMALRHRWYPALYATRPSVGPHALRFWGGLLEVLAAAGLADAELDNAFCMLADYVIGTTAINLNYDSWLGSDPDAVDQIHAYVRSAIDEQPTYAAYIDDYISTTNPATRRDRRYEYALECMLNSLDTRLRSGAAH
jgi:AcrR family transcriptional regulator